MIIRPIRADSLILGLPYVRLGAPVCRRHASMNSPIAVGNRLVPDPFLRHQRYLLHSCLAMHQKIQNPLKSFRFGLAKRYAIK